MAIARITGQDATNSSTTTSVVATYPGATTSGNLLIACFTSNDGGANGVISTSGWSQGAGDIGVNGGTGGGIWYKVANGTETTVTASATGASLMNIAIYEYSGFTGTPTLDKSSTGGTPFPATSASTGTTATTTANDEVAIVIAQYPIAGLFSSWSNSFNLRNTVTAGASQTMSTGDKILSATGTQTSTITITTSQAIGAGIATFKGSATPSNPGFLSFFLN